MDLAIANGLLKSGRGRTIQRTERARTRRGITRVLRARIHIVTRLGRAAFDRANPHYAFPGRSPHRTRGFSRQGRMHRRAGIATIGRARLGIIKNVLIVIVRNDLPRKTLVASTISGDLIAQGPIRRIRPHARIIRLTCVNGARVVIIAVRIDRTHRSRFRRLCAIRIEGARRKLRSCASKSKDRDDRGKKARAEGHQGLVFCV
jgi:hypothetical protein